MNTRYVNSTDLWNKTLSTALHVIVNWKEGKRPPEQQYESSKVVALKTKGNTRGFWLGETATITEIPVTRPGTVLNPTKKKSLRPTSQGKTPISRST